MQSIPAHPATRGTASTLLWPSSCNTGRLQRMQSSSWTWVKSMSRRLTRHVTTFHSTTVVGPIYCTPLIFQNSHRSSPWSTNGGLRIVHQTMMKTVSHLLFIYITFLTNTFTLNSRFSSRLGMAQEGHRCCPFIRRCHERQEEGRCPTFLRRGHAPPEVGQQETQRVRF
jgi:hypothetical protein